MTIAAAIGLPYACVLADCGERFAEYASTCPACGGRFSLRALAGRAAPSRAAPAIVSMDLNVQAPKRVPLPLRTLNEAFGANASGEAGFPIGSTAVLAGDPGAGKTSLALVVGEAFQRFGRSVLFAAAESTLPTLSLTALRVNAGRSLPLVFTRSVGEIVDAAEHAGADLVIVDQLNRVEPRRDALAHADRFVAFANASGRSLLLICERTKAGSTRGDRGVEHAVDAVYGLAKPEAAPDGTSSERPTRRLLIVSKSRFSAEGTYALTLGPNGWEEES